jgi:hypothetical protein
MLVPIGLAAALVLASAGVATAQAAGRGLDASIPLQGAQWQAPDIMGARLQGQQYRQNEAAMEATRAESDFCARWDWWGWGCSRSQHDQARQRIEDREQEALQLDESRAAAVSLREHVGGLIANDDCPGAVRAALVGGDFSLAREAREFCAGTTPAPAAPK